MRWGSCQITSNYLRLIYLFHLVLPNFASWTWRCCNCKHTSLWLFCNKISLDPYYFLALSLYCQKVLYDQGFTLIGVSILYVHVLCLLICKFICRSCMLLHISRLDLLSPRLTFTFNLNVSLVYIIIEMVIFESIFSLNFLSVSSDLYSCFLLECVLLGELSIFLSTLHLPLVS